LTIAGQAARLISLTSNGQWLMVNWVAVEFERRAGFVSDSQRETWWRAALCIAVVAVLCVTFNGGISVGASNHVGLLPVVRRLLDPNYLPNDFNITLRLYHHRVFAYLLAGLSSVLGEARAIIWLHVTGAAWLSTSLWVLCRALGLSLLAYLAAGLMLATNFLWTGLGLEENDFLGNPEIQPPLFAHAFVLLATASLIRQRWRLAAFCAGCAVLFHLQIGVIFTLLMVPLYAVRLREFGGREVVRLALGYLLPAAPALLHLFSMLQRGLLKAGASAYSLAAYIDFRHPHHFALMSARHAWWVAGHVLALVALWLWLRRNKETDQVAAARGVSVLVALSGMLVVLALVHFADYYLLRHDKFANLQSIRLSPALTVYGALGLLLFLKVRLARRGWWLPAAYGLLLALAAGWGVSVARQPEADFYWGVRHYRDPATLTGQRKRWVQMCNWIKANTPPDAVFLTPPGYEGFTVLTDRSNIVEFKINPDGALHMNEWFERLTDLTGGKLPSGRGLDNRRLLNQVYGELNAEQLLALGRKYRASYAVLPKATEVPFEVLHANEGLKLVKLPAATD
jgi:hypothetical protein